MPRWLIEAAQRHPDRIAVEDADGAVTYARLLDLARQHGGTDPFVIAWPTIDTVAQLHGCLLDNVGAVPLDPRLTEAEREARRARTGGTLGLARIVFTSGTTGEPKPVAIHPHNVLANALGSAVALGLDPQERWLCPLPLSHVGGLMVLLRSAIYGTTALLDGPERLLRGDVTLASLVPTQLSRLLDAGLRHPPGLRTILLGGASAPQALLERAHAAGVPVTPTYGLTEATSQVTVSVPGDTETSGWPLPGVELEFDDDREIIVRGPTVAGPGGALHTGDLGRLDDRGRLFVVGRKADTIVTGGENVAPAEVEAVLAAHPGVADAAVVGRPDPEWGEAVVALIVPAVPGVLDPAVLRQHCRARLAPFKIPKTFEAVAALPRTASGKLLRRELQGGPQQTA